VTAQQWQLLARPWQHLQKHTLLLLLLPLALVG
jgi:hypothetical protein